MDLDFKKIKKFLFPDGLSHGLVHFGESIFLLGSLSPWSFLLGSLQLISRGQRLENLKSSLYSSATPEGPYGFA